MLAERLGRLAERGPHADPTLAVARAVARAGGDVIADEPDHPRRGVALAMACLVAVLVAAGVLALVTADRAAAPASPSGSTPNTVLTTPAPTPTIPVLAPSTALAALPDLVSVPITVSGPAPTSWYRLQPDLDVAWFSPPSGPSMLCFRTPVLDATCRADTLRPTSAGGMPVGVTTAGDQLLVITLDGSDTLSISVDSGVTLTAPVARDAQLGWGVARFQLGAAAVTAGLGDTYAPGDASAAPTTTAPPTTSAPPTTTVPTVDVRAAAGAIDLDTSTVFGYAAQSIADPDDTVTRISATLGAPTSDTGWLPMPAGFECTGDDEFRTVWWGNFRITFERNRTTQILAAWTVGDASTESLAPIAGTPGPGTVDMTTAEGIGVGTTRADVERLVGARPNYGMDGNYAILGPGIIIFIHLDNDVVTALGSGRNDC